MTYIFFIALFFILLFDSFSVISEDERVLVFRFGIVNRVVGPGIVCILSQVEKKVWVDLPTHVPDWRGLSEVEIRKKVESIVVNSSDIRSFKRVKN